MWKKKSRIVATLMIILIIFCTSVFAVASNGSPQLVFSGITLEKNGDSVQGFIDFKVKNVENNGVTFTLEYDTDYVQLSNISDNSAITTEGRLWQWDNASAGFVPAGFLEINDSVLPTGSYTLLGDYDPTEKVGYGVIDFSLYLSNTAPLSDYIGFKTIPDEDGFLQEIRTLKAGDSEMTLGRISFRIEDPAAFAKLSPAELLKVFRVQTNETGGSAFLISYVDASSYPPHIFYDESQHLSYEFNITNTVTDVTVNNDNMTVSAAEIFRAGTEADLIAYLNTHMRDVTIEYTDGMEVADTIVWGDTSMDFSFSPAWDEKGGTYKVEQKYNDQFTLKATVNVTPVTVIGYTVTTNSAINYPLGEQPGSVSDLQMKFPEKAKVIFDAAIPGLEAYYAGIIEPWAQSAAPVAGANFFAGTQAGEYTFTAAVNESDIPLWATISADNKVDVKRSLGDATPAPTLDTGVQAEVDDNGVLRIYVSSVYVSSTGAIQPLPDTMNFIIRMPNGEVIDPSAVTSVSPSGIFTIELNKDKNGTAAGSAVITIKAGDKEDAFNDRLAKYINLGARGGDFEIAAKDGDLSQSEFIPFAPDPRSNIYTGTAYTFDYSDGKAPLFKFEEGMTAPPTTIALASGDLVYTTYSGYDGAEPGQLSTITVDSWTNTGSAAVTEGSIVTFTGRLSDTIYTNYGTVNNPKDIEVTLKLIVKEETGSEKIADIPDFIFDKKQVGYATSDLKAQDFTIENIGTNDILGLNVTIDSDAFILKGTPTYLLTAGDTSTFSIIPKTGLAEGVYTATVTIGSSKTAVLDTFTLTFEVTAKPVYSITLLVNDELAGKAVAKNGYTYQVGEIVYIEAIPNEDYIFEEWEMVVGGVSDMSSYNATSASFTMPALDITIRAHFSETDAARLRLSDLKILELDDTENQLLDDDLLKTTFAPNVWEYKVIVPSTSEQNKATFTLLEGITPDAIEINVTITPSGSAVSTATPVGISPGSSDGTYEIEPFDLLAAPVENILSIRLTYNGTSREYNVTIYREKAEEDLITFKYGNSPYGLIMQDDNIKDKSAAKADFDIANCFTEAYTPKHGTTDLIYHADAWGAGTGAYNYDKDDTALFVYGGQTFNDPGIEYITNSLGEKVDISDVKRKVTVSYLTAAAPANLIEDLSSVTETTHTLTAAYGTSESAIADGGRVRPGVYSIDYSFIDYDGTTAVISRPLIVLYERGDVDLSKEVNETDADLIEYRYREKLPYGNMPTYEAGSRLCLYRICDVNLDRNVNIADHNCIVNGTDDIAQFYPNI